MTDSKPLAAHRGPRHMCRLLTLSPLFVAIALIAGCTDEPAASSLAGNRASAPTVDRIGPPTGVAQLDELIELRRPLDETVTSNITDKRLHAERALRGRLQEAGREVGVAALAALKQRGEDQIDVQIGLLDVAAHAAPEDSRELLVNLIETSGPELGLRTEAVVLLAETSPARALEVLEPLIVDPIRNQTMPAMERMIEGFIVACSKTGHSPVDALCDVTTDFKHEPAARVRAVRELGKHPVPKSRKALEEIVVESSGDQYIRRIAAQALRESLPRETACGIFQRIASYEVDVNFQGFLFDLIEDNCW
jgi:hypothetical protein